MPSSKEPEQVLLTPQEAEALKLRITSCDLSNEDIKIIVGLVTFNLWLQNQLSRAKLSIHRLKKLFGFSTEKKTLKNRKEPR